MRRWLANSSYLSAVKAALYIALALAIDWRYAEIIPCAPLLYAARAAAFAALSLPAAVVAWTSVAFKSANAKSRPFCASSRAALYVAWAAARAALFAAGVRGGVERVVGVADTDGADDGAGVTALEIVGNAMNEPAKARITIDRFI